MFSRTKRKSSFCGSSPFDAKVEDLQGHGINKMIRRSTRTHPDQLINSRINNPCHLSFISERDPFFTKNSLQEQIVPNARLLLNVTVLRSIGVFHVLISKDATVHDVIKATLALYAKEGRRPLLSSEDPSSFGLHYSQFSMDSLNPSEAIDDLGSRNFFLCPKAMENMRITSLQTASPSISSSDTILDSKLSTISSLSWSDAVVCLMSLP
eukprot:Gb_07712 [translate_table: standard]